MKIKSLILGSVAAVGLSTGAFAAGLETSVLTSLDACDAQGITGLTLSSEENCLQISGGVSYELVWGDYNETDLIEISMGTDGGFVNFTVPDDGFLGLADVNLDWSSTTSAWLQFVGTADSSWGPASATIILEWEESTTIVNEQNSTNPSNAVMIDEAFVSIGDTTVLTAGRTGTIADFDNSDPFADLFIDVGVIRATVMGLGGTGGDVIQVTSDLGNGFSVGGALENLNDGTAATAGTFVGVMAYEGNGVSASATLLAGGFLDGNVEAWAFEAGMTAEVTDTVSLRGAFATDSDSEWAVMGSAEAVFDMFTLAGAVGLNSFDEISLGVSAEAEVSSGVTINAAFRWFEDSTLVPSDDAYEFEVGMSADVTETVTISGAIGLVGSNNNAIDVFYGNGSIDWSPGGGFTSSLGADFWDTGAYQLTFTAAKDFE